MAASHPSDASRQLLPRGRVKTRTLSGHRHSWREPSVDLFTVAEEADNNVFIDDHEATTQSENDTFIDGYSESTFEFNMSSDNYTSPSYRSEHGLSPTILTVNDDDIPELSLETQYPGEGSRFDTGERARL